MKQTGNHVAEQENRETGMVMLEAVLYYPFVIMLFAFLICLTLFFVQRYFAYAAVEEMLNEKVFDMMEQDETIASINLDEIENELIRYINDVSVLRSDYSYSYVRDACAGERKLSVTLICEVQMPVVAMLFDYTPRGPVYMESVDYLNVPFMDFKREMDCAQIIGGFSGDNSYLSRKYGTPFWTYFWKETGE